MPTKSNCTTPCNSSIRTRKSSLVLRYAPIARDTRTSVSYRTSSLGAGRTSKSLFTAGTTELRKVPCDLMLGGGKLIRVPKSGKEVFVVTIALYFLRAAAEKDLRISSCFSIHGSRGYFLARTAHVIPRSVRVGVLLGANGQNPATLEAPQLKHEQGRVLEQGLIQFEKAVLSRSNATIPQADPVCLHRQNVAPAN